MKSLANTEKFPARIGKEINREMIAWDNEFNEDRKFFMTAWDGFRFHSNFNVCYAHACDVETDENSFRAPYIFTKECEMIKPSCLGEKRLDWCGCSLKCADTKTRPMTAREIYELAHQGAAFCRYEDGFENIVSVAYAVEYLERGICYCLPCDMTDDEPKTWNWRELNTERKLEKVG